MWWKAHLKHSNPKLVMLHHVKSLCEFDEAEAHCLIYFSCLLQNYPEVGNLIALSSSWPKSSLLLSYLAFKLDLHSVQNHSHQYRAGVRDQCDGTVVVAL